ncbi:MAG: hypothetical protein QXI17_02155 [Candidatus Bilamarchaeaceae archaeon]
MKIREYLAAFFAIATIYSCGEPAPLEHPALRDVEVVSDINYRDSNYADVENSDANYTDNNVETPCSKCNFVEKNVFFLNKGNKSYFLTEDGRAYILLEENGSAYPFIAKLEEDKLYLYSEKEINYNGYTGYAKIEVSSSGFSKMKIEDKEGKIIEFQIDLIEDFSKRDITYLNYYGSAFFGVSSIYMNRTVGEVLNGNSGVYYVLFFDDEGSSINVLISPIIITKKGAYFSMEINDKNSIKTENFYIKEGEKYSSSYKINPNESSSSFDIILFATDGIMNTFCLTPTFNFKYIDSVGNEAVVQAKPSHIPFKVGEKSIVIKRYLKKDDSQNQEFIFIEIFKGASPEMTKISEAILSKEGFIADPFWPNSPKIAVNSVDIGDGEKLIFLGLSSTQKCEQRFTSMFPTAEEIRESIKKIKEENNNQTTKRKLNLMKR